MVATRGRACQIAAEAAHEPCLADLLSRLSALLSCLPFATTQGTRPFKIQTAVENFFFNLRVFIKE